LRLQAWRPPDLAVLQGQLGRIDLVSMLWNTMEAQRAEHCHFLETASRAELAGILSPDAVNTSQAFKNRVVAFMPRGWVQQNMVLTANLGQNWIDAIDRLQGVIHPRQSAEALKQMKAAYSRGSPFSFLSKSLTPNLVKPLLTAAHTQNAVNQALVVCALQQFRIADGSYPATLDPLVPRVIRVLPVDVISGEPLKYHRDAPGRFTLYSVGWNEKDDGGTTTANPENGDWVWISQ